jgi:phosphoserine phosphatase
MLPCLAGTAMLGQPTKAPVDTQCSSAEQCLAALELYRQRGLPLDGVTVSSDSCGSLPVFDAAGRLVKYDRGHPGVLS